MSGGRGGKVIGCCAAGLVALAAILLMPSGEAATITASGPVTLITTTTTLRGNVHTTYQSQDMYWPFTTGATPGDFATWVAVGGVLYGPGSCSLCPAGTAYTTVSQTLAGSGSAASPYLLTTTVSLGASGIRLTQIDSYVNGNTYYMTQLQLRNLGAAPQPLAVWRGADCLLNNQDANYGEANAATVEVACTATANSLVPSPYIRWLSTTGTPTYTEEGYGTLWQKISSQTALANTCLCATLQDGAEGLYWSFTLNGGASNTLEHCTEFAPMLTGLTCVTPVLCAPDTITVTAGTTVQLNATGGDGSYTWSTGATGPSTTVRYTSSGTYSVTVQDGNGQQGTCTIEVVPPEMSCNPSTQTVLRDTGVSFAVLGGESPWSWVSPGGDPAASIPPPSSLYTSYGTLYRTAGTYNVQVTDNTQQVATCEVVVEDPPLACDPASQWVLAGDIAHFTASGGSGAYAWNSNGGRPAAGQGDRFFTAYETPGPQAVTVRSGAQVETCDVDVVPRPQAAFAYAPSYVGAPWCGDLHVQFADESAAGGFPLASWAWEFGDGGSSVEQAPAHTYGAPGTYKVTLTVTDEMGISSAWSQPITLSASGCAGGREDPQEPGRAAGGPRDGRDASHAGRDSDKDGVPDVDDLCPSARDSGQADADGDGRGDACDADRDGDGIANAGDACADVPDPLQADRDGDGIGDLCDEAAVLDETDAGADGALPRGGERQRGVPLGPVGVGGPATASAGVGTGTWLAAGAGVALVATVAVVALVRRQSKVLPPKFR